MIPFLELALIVVPIAIYFAKDKNVVSDKLTIVILSAFFIMLLIELALGWLIVIGATRFDFPEPSIFVGTEIWNILMGPFVLALYVYVISEVLSKSPRG